MTKNLMIFVCTLFMVALASNVIADGLEIKNVRISVDYDEAYTYRLERKSRDGSESGLLNGSVISAEILPGANVTFTFWIENSLKDQEINNIVPRITIEDLDDGADVDFEADEIDLEHGQEERIDVKFFIPLDADSITYNVRIEAEAEDNGIDYDTQITLKMPVKKQSHDIRIINTLLNPAIIECGRSSKLTAEIVNAGSSEENDVSLEFKSLPLGIEDREDDIFLKSSNEASIDEKTYSKTSLIKIPKEFEQGTYQILVNLYWKKYILFDQKKISIIVRNCKSPIINQTTNDTTTKKNESVVVTSNQTRISTPVVVQPRRLDNPIVIIVASGAALIILLFLAIMILYGRK